MKKGFLLILVCLIVGIVVSGCSISDLGKIKTIDDEIDNSKIVILRDIYKSSDKGMSNYRALITYSKKIKANEPVVTAVNFKISTDPKEIILAQKSYLVTDEQKYELLLANISSKTESYTETDSSFLDGRVDVRTYTTYIMEGDLNLSADITGKIKTSTKLIYRLYLGTRPLTFEISKKDLDRVKTFIDTE